jgi:prevent-host-death family protein
MGITHSRRRLPKQVSVTLARRHFFDLLGQVERSGARFILYRRGKPVAAIVPMEDLKLIERLKQVSSSP